MNKRIGLALVAFAITACSTSKNVEPLSNLKEYTTESLYKAAYEPGCKSMLENYCQFLYSPEVSGNMKVARGPDSVLVLQGETHNDFSGAFYEYSRAKIRNQRALPYEFYAPLQEHNYFDILKVLLARKPREQMSLSERVDATNLELDLNIRWEMAFNEAVLARIEKKFPGFHKIKDNMVPVEMRIEQKRIRRGLLSEIAKAIWQKHPKWEKVENHFEELRASYLNVISRLEIPDDLRARWTERIKTVKLVLPGSAPEIADFDCASTKNNAYYYSYFNELTVCAGDFNSEDIVETLAHELGHALDNDRSLYLFETNSDFGKSLAAIRNDVCTPKDFSCSDWAKFKDKYQAQLAKLDSYQPDLPDFEKCLKRKPQTKPIAQTDLDRLAATVVNQKLSDLADDEIFLRITKDKIPMPDGKSRVNPNFMNPCSYYLWTHGEEPIDDEITTLIFFTAEYRCSAGEPTERLRKSIEVAKNMSKDVTKEALKIEGELSPRDLLEAEGFASSPVERFADVIGSYAFAEHLRQFSTAVYRRNIFLASSSWQCTKPSLASRFPAESSVEKQYIFGTHVEGEDRQKELFSQPVRETLACQKDFQFNECALPYKKSPPADPENQAAH